MVAKLNFIKPTAEIVQAVADDMRQFDIDEVIAAGNKSPLDALVKGVDVSTACSVAMLGDKPLCIFGLRNKSILGAGVIWMLGTNTITKCPREIMHYTKLAIREMLEECSMLYNYVHSKNTTSINWLSGLGFTICEPEEYGPHGEMFHKFYMERD